MMIPRSQFLFFSRTHLSLGTIAGPRWFGSRLWIE
jgi:hypothetical protein